MVKPLYGPEHRAIRRRVEKLLPLPCVFCGRVILPGSAWDLDHEPGTTNYRGAACQSCNRRDGGIRGNKSAKRRTKHMELRNVCAGLDLARDRTGTALVIAGYADHPNLGEVVAAHLHTFPGVATPEAITAAWQETRPTLLAVNGTGHVRVLSEPLKNAVPVHEASGQDMADANGRLLDQLRAGRLKLPVDRRELKEAVQFAKVRQLADGVALDKKTAERDLSPLVALELAVWAVLRANPSIYEARGLVTL